MGFDPAFTGFGTSHRGGSVPDPGSGDRTGQFLSAAGDWEYPYTFSSELGGGASTIDFSGIAESARHLRFYCRVRSDSIAGGSPLTWAVGLNSLGGTAYSFQILAITAAHGALVAASSGGAAILLCDPTPDSSTDRPIALDRGAGTAHYTMAIIDVPYYANQTPGADQPIVAHITNAIDNAGSPAGLLVTGRIDAAALSGAPISRVTFTIVGGNFSADSRIQMIGVS